jgi:hypothetical protein
MRDPSHIQRGDGIEGEKERERTWPDTPQWFTDMKCMYTLLPIDTPPFGIT